MPAHPEAGQGRLERPRIDLFLFHYLAYRKQGDVAIGHLFQEFRTWYTQYHGASPVESERASLGTHAAAFRKLFERDEQTRLGVFASRLRVLDTSTVYPVLLYLLGAGESRLAPGALDRIVTDLESFLVRRMVVGLTPKNYNQLFRQLLRALSQSDQSLPEVVRTFLSTGTGDTLRWPDDTEFAKTLHGSPLYSRLPAAKLNMLLQGVNRSHYTDRQETLPPVIEKLEIEHVMPQAWKELDYPVLSTMGDGFLAFNSPEQREVVLHTPGNLTLLTQRLNKEVSNGAFRGKRGAIEQFRERLVVSQAHSADDLAQAIYNAEDPGWAGALTVLSHPRIASRARPFIELRRGFIEFDDMKSAPNLSSHGEQLMIAVACSLYNSAAKIDMATLSACLEYTWLDYAIAGMLAFQHRTYVSQGTSEFVPPLWQAVES